MNVDSTRDESGTFLTIVIPAYNEQARIARCLDTLAAWIEQFPESVEVIIVDDGSRDGTSERVETFAQGHPEFRVHRFETNRGKGAAVREGLRQSRGNLVLFSDTDLSTPIGDFETLRRALDEGADFAIGSRALPESNIVLRQAWYRDRMGKIFNQVVRFLTGIPFSDTQCGFKLLRGDAARQLAEEMREDGFAFDVEMILLGARRGLRIRDMPVTWRNDVATKVHPVFDSLRMLVALQAIVGRIGRYREPA